jgi:hypothetical protein
MECLFVTEGGPLTVFLSTSASNHETGIISYSATEVCKHRYTFPEQFKCHQSGDYVCLSGIETNSYSAMLESKGCVMKMPKLVRNTAM